MAMAAEIAGWEEVKKAEAVADAGDEKHRAAALTEAKGSASDVTIFEALNQVKGKIKKIIRDKEEMKISSGVNIGDDEEGKDDEDDEDDGFGYEAEEMLGSRNNSGANSDSKSNAGSGDDSEKGSNSPSHLASNADNKPKEKIPKKGRKKRRSKKKVTEPGIEYQSGNSTAHSGDESTGAKSDSSSKSNSGPKSGLGSGNDKNKNKLETEKEKAPNNEKTATEESRLTEETADERKSEKEKKGILERIMDNLPI